MTPFPAILLRSWSHNIPRKEEDFPFDCETVPALTQLTCISQALGLGLSRTSDVGKGTKVTKNSSSSADESLGHCKG